eukprot:scaffold20027_cov138-Isochrysis_galbana.AAC.2
MLDSCFCMLFDATSLRCSSHTPFTLQKASGLKQCPAPTRVPSARNRSFINGSSERRSVWAAVAEPEAAAATSMNETLEFCAHSASVSPSAEKATRAPWRLGFLRVQTFQEGGKHAAPEVRRCSGHDGCVRMPGDSTDSRTMLLDHLGDPEVVRILIVAHGDYLGAAADCKLLLIWGPAHMCTRSKERVNAEGRVKPRADQAYGRPNEGARRPLERRWAVACGGGGRCLHMCKCVPAPSHACGCSSDAQDNQHGLPLGAVLGPDVCVPVLRSCYDSVCARRPSDVCDKGIVLTERGDPLPLPVLCRWLLQ